VTALKLFAKKILAGINAAISNSLPVVDFRKGQGLQYTRHNLMPPVLLKGMNPNYHYEGNPYWVELFSKGIEVRGVDYIHLNKAYLVGRGLILNDEKQVLLESAIFQKEYLNKLLVGDLLLKYRFVQPGLVLSKTIPLLNKLSRNYFHWTVESLSRIAALAIQQPQLKHQYKLIIAADSPGFVEATLTQLVQWPKENIIRHGNRNAAVLQDTFMIDIPYTRNVHTRMVAMYNPTAYKVLNQLAKHNIGNNPALPAYVLLSRGKASQRRIVNEAVLLQQLQPIPLQLVYAEDLTYTQQVQLFKQAKLIITPHSAGLTNLVYCQSNPLVIELFPESRNIRDASYYYQVAAAIPMQYQMLHIPVINAQQDMELSGPLLQKIKAVITKHVTA
jgi:hypothetical protein